MSLSSFTGQWVPGHHCIRPVVFQILTTDTHSSTHWIVHLGTELIIVDVLLPVSLTGVKGSVSILTLVCPEPQGLQQVPVIIGTNTSIFHRLTMLSQGSGVSNQAHSLRIQSSLLKTCLHQDHGKEDVP